MNLRKASEENLISGKYLFSSDHILYSKIRPYLNKVASPNINGICSADIYPLKPQLNKITKSFLKFILTSSDFLTYAEKHSDRTNIPKINRQALEAYPMPLPPLPLQTRFATILANIEQQKEIVRKQQAESEALFGRLLQEAFGG